jgi:uncharacterized phage protein gp47/JayE
MAFTRPTLAALVSRIQADFVSRLGGSGAPLRRSVVAVFSRVLAGAVHMLHGHVEYLARQLFADLADDAYLVRIASLYGLSKSPATFAVGVIQATGTDGQEVPTGAVLRRADGEEFTVDAGGTIASGVLQLPVTAVLAGESANTPAASVLTFESPYPGVDAEVETAELAGGADVESTASLRRQVLARIRLAAQGGATADYELWTLSVDGVTRVWVYPNELGAGTVVVYFARDEDAGSPIPSAGEVTEVQEYLDTVRPVTAAVTARAIVAKGWIVEITLTPSAGAVLGDVQDAVEAEIIDLFRTEGVPGGTLPFSKVRTAIGTAAGVEDFIVTSIMHDLESGDPDLEHDTGEIPVLDSITWN